MIEGQLFDIFGDMPALRLQKCRIIYHLARTITTPGDFVDLGVWHGYSTIAMGIGALQNNIPRTVFGVDTFITRHGWAGESYGEDDKVVFDANWLKANALLDKEVLPLFIHQVDALERAEWWISPIALLHWDLGCDNRLENDIKAWWPHLAPGATLVIHDTMDSRFRTPDVMAFLVAFYGAKDYNLLPAGLHTITKET